MIPQKPEPDPKLPEPDPDPDPAEDEPAPMREPTAPGPDVADPMGPDPIPGL